MASPTACPVGAAATRIALVRWRRWRQRPSAGIPTFVVGIATAGSTAHDTLNEMADKGRQAAHAAPPATTRW